MLRSFDETFQTLRQRISLQSFLEPLIGSLIRKRLRVSRLLPLLPLLLRRLRSAAGST